MFWGRKCIDHDNVHRITELWLILLIAHVSTLGRRGRVNPRIIRIRGQWEKIPFPSSVLWWRKFFSRDYFSSRPSGAYSNLKLKWHFLSCYQLHFYDLNVFFKRPGTASRASAVHTWKPSKLERKIALVYVEILPSLKSKFSKEQPASFKINKYAMK